MTKQSLTKVLVDSVDKFDSTRKYYALIQIHLVGLVACQTLARQLKVCDRLWTDRPNSAIQGNNLNYYLRVTIFCTMILK